MKIPQTPPAIPEDFDYGKALDELVTLRKFSELFETDNNEYPYWDKWKYIAKEWNYDPQKLWAIVKTSRRNNRFNFSSTYRFRLNTPSLIQEYLHDFDMNLGGTIQGEGIVPDQEKERYLLSSLMEEAIASSQLEGAVTTRKLAKEMLETSRKPRNESEQMILNNYEAMKWIVENKHQPITEQNILTLHSIITKHTLTRQTDEGAFRTDDNIHVVDAGTGEIVHRPPLYKELPELMSLFYRFANDQQKFNFFIHPVVRGIILHFLIGYIHPFADGNGRTARTLFYWYLLRKGYWLIEYMSVSRVILNAKAQYARAYLHTEIDDNDLTYFVLYNLQCIKTALKDLKQYIDRKTKEKKQTFELLRHSNFNERQVQILQEILHDAHSSFTVNKLEQWFGVSNQTARNDLNYLVNTGLMEYRKAGKQLLFFPAKDVAAKLRALNN
ncbi:MAG: Fic family protein [Chitinophagaceae bacterium]|nr:Fic family protein [Chitinophagaceae bacterium]MCW5925570.1 Fic family protein [Chitinophagaceae bacterium]